ncbi:putative F-box/LRR-repeat protein At5g02930 isoform X1 [Sorghum bicolor]|nr:putative F-box/LRR-repeat protein At5g02930 isoform X1 [Sorghum bicolor]|eukprot:XP_021317439.1 putative F-box/LRR-repeat protein At5g02930 isoform X1 [Sorghum bicolor]
MAADQRRSRRSGGEDRISGLPDELLHDILVRLRCARAAARTSVLSRRWRHVWAHLPELRLDQRRRPTASGLLFLDTIDAALAGYSAPTLERLSISIPSNSNAPSSVVGPGARIAPWLHFAAARVVGELNLFLRAPQTFVVATPEVVGEEAVLELPVCEQTKRIELFLQYADTHWLRPQASGSGLFTALTFLKVDGHVRMTGSDLTALVSTQCPCLRELDLFITLIVNFHVLIHSNSLHTLVLRVLETRRLEVVAPRLEELTVFARPLEAHISATKLVKVAWHGVYDPHLHRFVDVGSTLRLLKTSSQALSLTKRFDEVDELDHLSIDLKWQDVARYESFLNETNKLLKCKSLCISLLWEHALVPVMWHLLRSCNGTKRLRVHLWGPWSQRVMHSCLPACPYRLEESLKIDVIDLSSLEEVEISGFSGSHEQMELVEFLSSNARILKRLRINYHNCRRPKEAREKVRSMCHPNLKVEFFVFHEGRQVLVE